MFSFMFYVYLFQINVFARPLRILKGMESFEVLGLRLAYVNSVLNPWLYILLRKETVMFYRDFHACESVVKPKTKKIPPNQYHFKFVYICNYMFYVSCNTHPFHLLVYQYVKPKCTFMLNTG